jgi:hypothetical protein
MVTANDQPSIPIATPKLEIGTVSELWALSRQFLTYLNQGLQGGAPGNPTERQIGTSCSKERFQLKVEPLATSINLFS